MLRFGVHSAKGSVPQEVGLESQIFKHVVPSLETNLTAIFKLYFSINTVSWALKQLLNFVNSGAWL